MQNHSKKKKLKKTGAWQKWRREHDRFGGGSRGGGRRHRRTGEATVHGGNVVAVDIKGTGDNGRETRRLKIGSYGKT